MVSRRNSFKKKKNNENTFSTPYPHIGNCTLLIISRKFFGKNFNESDLNLLRLFARVLHIFSVFHFLHEKRAKTHLSRCSLPRVNEFYCFFAAMVEYALYQSVIFHPPINSPVGADFSARNPIARFLAVRNKTARRSTPSPRGDTKSTKIQLSRAIRSRFDP